jgi:GTP-binding protein HflX
LSKQTTYQTVAPRPRAFLIGVEIHNQPALLTMEDSLVELALLADTAGLDVVGEATQRLDQPNSVTYIGSGKVDEVKILVEEILADIVIFDNELSPRHLRELEERLGPTVQITDRTALILDIFAQHARTREGSLQVELAQYEYRLPRLTRAWTHLARQAGGAAGRSGSVGGVGLRGPGEKQLEVDRREIRRKITFLKAELEKVRAHRMRYRAQRKRSRIPTVAIVGYTNSGKSTLLNSLAKAGVFVADQLFATLDPTTRRVALSPSHTILFTDTVGFIQKLPTQLVAAFRATLEEITEADMLVHIVDITHPNALAQWQSVQQTLKEINADKIPTITTLNKIDRLLEPETARQAIADYPNAVAISSLTGKGIPEFIRAVEENLYETYQPIAVRLPYSEGALISLFHEQGQVEHVQHSKNGVSMVGLIPGRLITRFQSYLLKSIPPQPD